MLIVSKMQILDYDLNLVFARGFAYHVGCFGSPLDQKMRETFILSCLTTSRSKNVIGKLLFHEFYALVSLKKPFEVLILHGLATLYYFITVSYTHLTLPTKRIV